MFSFLSHTDISTFLTSLASLITIVSGLCGGMLALFKFLASITLPRIRIFGAKTYSRSYGELLAQLFARSQDEPLFRINIINGKQKSIVANISGYVFHYGRDSRRGLGFDSLQHKPDTNLSALFEIEPIDDVVLPGSSHVFDVLAKRNCLFSDKAKLARGAFKLGMYLRHDVIVLRVGRFFIRRFVFYDICTQKVLSFFDLVRILLCRIFDTLSYCIRRDYLFIPDDAYTDLKTVVDGLSSIDFSRHKVLMNCGDDDNGVFCKYFTSMSRSATFMCVWSKSYTDHDADEFVRSHSIHGWINNVKPFCCLDDSYYKDCSSSDFSYGDFRHPLTDRLLSEFSFVTTCPPKSLFRDYVDKLLQYHIDFKILGTEDDIIGLESKLYIDGDTFDADFYVLPSFIHFDLDKKHRYRVTNDGDYVIRVKNCCWFVPNYDNEGDSENESD